MKQERKIALLMKQNDSLKNKIKNLEAKNKVLQQNHDALSNINSTLNESIFIMHEKFELAERKYLQTHNELQAVKKECQDALAVAYALKKKYQTEMDSFISGLKKQK